MSKKNFWNKIGLPSVADIHLLLEEYQRQEQRIDRLEQENAELARSLLEMREELTAAMEKTSQLQCEQTNAAAAEVKRLIAQTNDETAKVKELLFQAKQQCDTQADIYQAKWEQLLKLCREIVALTDNSHTEYEQLFKLCRQIIDQAAQHEEKTVAVQHMLDENHSALVQREDNQDEMLRILIANALQGDIEALISEEQ